MGPSAKKSGVRRYGGRARCLFWSINPSIMSDLLIKSIHAQPISFRMQSPFITSQGKKVETHNMLVTIVLTDGTVGYGEGSSSIAMPQETADAMQRVIRELIPELRAK